MNVHRRQLPQPGSPAAQTFHQPSSPSPGANHSAPCCPRSSRTDLLARGACADSLERTAIKCSNNLTAAPSRLVGLPTTPTRAVPEYRRVTRCRRTCSPHPLSSSRTAANSRSTAPPGCWAAWDTANPCVALHCELPGWNSWHLNPFPAGSELPDRSGRNDLREVSACHYEASVNDQPPGPPPLWVREKPPDEVRGDEEITNGTPTPSPHSRLWGADLANERAHYEQHVLNLN